VQRGMLRSWLWSFSVAPSVPTGAARRRSSAADDSVRWMIFCRTSLGGYVLVTA
jgi:hypothetical protein